MWCCVPLLLAPPAIPDSCPRFVVPGHQAEMATLRELWFLHYPGSGPKATLWDEWLSICALWPADTTDGRMDLLRQQWRTVLSSRGMDDEGYVWTHQHGSIAHQHGWPFPFWGQGGDAGVWGWHFSLQGVPPGWGPAQPNGTDGWARRGAADRGVDERAWNLELTEPNALATAPPLRITPFQSPFIQLRWVATGLAGAAPYLEWTTAEAPDWSPARRIYFASPPDGELVYEMIPVCRHPEWRGEITGLRLGFGNSGPATAGVQALFTQYDTRHPINNSNFIRGCAIYFTWTRDLDFLRANLGRIRKAMRYAMHTLGGLEHRCIVVPYVGHDGRSGVVYENGEKRILTGHGIGNHYWDIVPCGYEDGIATLYYADALETLAELEAAVAAHPEWNLPGGADAFAPAFLRGHAAEVRAHASQRFWNEETGRFGLGRDDRGILYDYGYTFMNCEAIYYGVANDEQARSIVAWLDGERMVDGDTSQGDDIYHWRFAARATTRRNIDWYGWYWTSPESIPFGGQVQDGGAVLGWSYHDLMARLRFLGPDNAWARLREILAWFAEVQAGGGYRAWYAADPARGSLQGGGTAGGLGLDMEFFESALVPQVMLYGFLGFTAHPDGIGLDPRLPSDWPSLRITRIRYQSVILNLEATADQMVIECEGEPHPGFRLYLPAGTWLVEDADGTRRAEGVVPVRMVNGGRVRLAREG